MGGLVTASLACERKPDVAGFVISGAALARPRAALARRAAGCCALARRLAPRSPSTNGLDPQGLSTDPDVVHRYLEDPLVTRRITISLACELFSRDAAHRGARQRGRAPAARAARRGRSDLRARREPAFAAAAPRPLPWLPRHAPRDLQRARARSRPRDDPRLASTRSAGAQRVSDELSHLERTGRAHMVDVGDKPVTYALVRRARGRPDDRRDLAPDRRGSAPQGRRARDGAARRHPGREADRRVDPALPLAAPRRRGGRARSRIPPAPSAS